ncbi:MAG: stage II sporulation protein D [Bacillota bacterium]|uniref:stage II sporulation protein D n=1 Tax=Virgibacillus TaxID=84406 RepID=UPI0003F64677|nr:MULTISPECIES: stage II sporulation protein D [Bacillaceae]MCC2252528.1 stage II sporulation protein D [Virgibacillus sp. AGTR]MDY7046553.1 stage II sporulation protein D [Virgibacillus sp. M23]QRZ18507.1 stage II sporulation protein D [Virgibacillus sp. AGTR]WBX81894.1 stage II sporulation protein D [Virgibacillus salarius]
MKKSQYQQKSGLKDWKKRNSSLLKKIKEKQRASYKNKKLPSKQPVKNKLLPIKSKKPYFLTKPPKQPSKWKIPVMFLLSTLIIIILVVPTLIVVPFAKGDRQEGATPTENETTAQVELGSSPFSVSVMRSASDKVEGIPLEEYVVGVVASEMPADFEKEALKAQALAARTYIVNYKLHGNEEESKKSDVTDTVQHQVYKDEYQLQKQWGSDFNWKINKVKKAVLETEGEILTYKDAPITPAFFSTSNGYTENSEDYWENELPYLRSVASPWDKESPKYLDQKTFSSDQLEKALELDFSNKTPLPIQLTRTDSKRVEEIEIAGQKFSGRDIREKLDLRSSDFTVEQKNNHFIFTTKGFGHGIGMSQYGANGMAKDGKSYKDIVQYYYQNVQISTVDNIAPTLVAK